MRDQFSNPYKRLRNVIILYVLVFAFYIALRNTFRNILVCTARHFCHVPQSPTCGTAHCGLSADAFLVFYNYPTYMEVFSCNRYRRTRHATVTWDSHNTKTRDLIQTVILLGQVSFRVAVEVLTAMKLSMLFWILTSYWHLSYYLQEFIHFLLLLFHYIRHV